jgi:hypothetical protein
VPISIGTSVDLPAEWVPIWVGIRTLLVTIFDSLQPFAQGCEFWVAKMLPQAGDKFDFDFFSAFVRINLF